MQQIVIQNIQLSHIQPSPYQPRQHFDEQRLEDLAQNIQTYGLIHSILVREKDSRYELMVGERRVRAAKLLGWDTIRAEIRNVSDPIARGIVLSENLKRDDLTAIEQIEAIALWIDNTLCQDNAYQELQAPSRFHLDTTLKPELRKIAFLLMKLNSDERHHTTYLANKFISKVKSAFTDLPERIDWQSFYINDLQPYSKMDEEVKQIAVTKKLNKSQTKALQKLKKESQKIFQQVKDTGKLKVENEHFRQEEVDIQEISSREIEKKTKEIRWQNHREQERQQLELVTHVIHTELKPVVHVQPGDWWQLKNHLLFCGDTSNPEFLSHLPKSIPFAFADPPYNADAAEWDNNFNWKHDYLSEKVSVVAVTPGIVSIFDFAKMTKMPYVWSLACWIANGMTRGAMGFGNWIYVALFSYNSIHRDAQDFVKVTIKTSETEETDHKGRKPTELLRYLILLYSQKGDTIIDPFLGSGTTLLVAEALHRKCIGGDLNPVFCQEIINRWELLTRSKAIKVENPCK